MRVAWTAVIAATAVLCVSNVLPAAGGSAQPAPFVERWGNIQARHTMSPVDRARSAKTYEDKLLSIGIDAYVAATGAGNTTLAMRWIGFSRPVVYQMLNESGFLAGARDMGFKRIEITDGYRMLWKFRRVGETFEAE